MLAVIAVLRRAGQVLVIQVLEFVVGDFLWGVCLKRWAPCVITLWLILARTQWSDEALTRMNTRLGFCVCLVVLPALVC